MTLLVKDYTDIELCIEQAKPRGPRPPRYHHRRLRQDLVRAVRGPPWLFRAGGLPCQAIGRAGRARGARPGLPALFGALRTRSGKLIGGLSSEVIRSIVNAAA